VCGFGHGFTSRCAVPQKRLATTGVGQQSIPSIHKIKKNLKILSLKLFYLHLLTYVATHYAAIAES